MGFDNECILNIQSLAGEYFCPVCRLLVYPNEAIQSQCTHLYCKPCLTYVVSTTRACPYDGYLVTEADSKPLIESNKALAETIGKIAVHCLYHRSGCTWQGPLSECTTHCSGCAFGNSPVVCNRCGIQIVHRQVQEHAQNCPGVQPQAQQAEGVQDVTAPGAVAAADQSQTSTQAGTATSQAQTSQTTAVLPPAQDPNQQANSNPQAQAVAQAAVATPEQWYQQQQQQYQQYYQQYPGYDPYQQHYQQYYPYQQQAVQQYQQQQLQGHPPNVPVQHQPQLYAQPQPQPQLQPQPQVQPQAQPQPQPHVQPQPQPHVQAPVAAQNQNQAQVNPQQQLHPAVQPHSQIQSQTHPPPHGHPHPQTQPYPQAQPHPIQPHPQQHMQMPQYQQPHSQMQHPQPQIQPQPHSQLQSQHHPLPQPQLQPQAQPQPQPHLQLHPPSQPSQPPNPNAQPQIQHPTAQAVTGHHSYQQPQPQPQPHQQIPLGAPQHSMHMHPQSGTHQQPQHPVQMQSQFPQQPPQMRPPQSHAPMPNQQQPALLPSPGQVPNIPPAQHQPVHPHAQHPGHPVHQRPIMQPIQQSVPQQYVQQQQPPQPPFAGQPSGSVQNQLHRQGPFVQQQQPPPVQSQLRPQGPPHSTQLHSHSYPQAQQNVALSHGMQSHQSQNYVGRPMMPNHGVQSQPFPQSPGGLAGAVQVRPTQLSANQPYANQNYPLRTNNQLQPSSEQQLGYMQQSAHAQSGAILKPTVLERQGDYLSEKSLAEREAESSSQKTGKKDPSGLVATSGLRADSVEIKTLKSETDIMSMDDDGNPIGEDEDKTSQADTSAKEIPESIRTLGTDAEPHAVENGSGEPVVKQMVKEEATESSMEPSHGGKSVEFVAEDQKDIPNFAPKQVERSSIEDKEIQDIPLLKNPPMQQMESVEEQSGKLQKDAVDAGSAVQNVIPRGPISGSERSNSQTPLISRDRSHQPSHHSVDSNHEQTLHQPGYQERNLPQAKFTSQAPGVDEYRGFLPPGQVQGKGFVQPSHPVPITDQGRHQLPPMHYGPSSHQQRPAAPSMLQSMPPPGPPHHTQVPGHPPTHLRPQGLGHLPLPGQPLNPSEHFQQPVLKQPHGSFHPEIPPGGTPGPGSTASFGRGPSHLGPPQRSFEPQPFAPQGHYNQGNVPPSHSAPPRISQGELVGGPPLGALPPGSFDSHGGMMARAPPHGPEGQMGQQRPANPMEAEMFQNQRPSYFDGRQPDSHVPGSLERGPFGQPSGIQSTTMKMNGAPGHDSSPALGLRDGRFTSQPEERLNPFPMQPARHVLDRRESDEDLKRFPRPSHLDAEPVPKFGSYLSPLRHVDRGPHGIGMDAAPRPLDKVPHGFNYDTGLKLDSGSRTAPSRFLPPYQPGGTLHPNDAGDRPRPGGFHDDNVGRADSARTHPDFLGPVPGFGRHHMDGLPPRSPVRGYPGIPSRGFGALSGVPGSQSGLDDIDGRESRPFGEGPKSFNPSSNPIGNSFHESRFPILPSHLRRGELDGPGNLRMGEHMASGPHNHLRSGDLIGQDILPSHLRRGEHLGPRNLPSHLRLGEAAGFGSFPGHGRMGEMAGPGNFPPHLPLGDSFGGNKSSHPRLGELGFRSSYSLQGYPNDGGFHTGDMETFDNPRKRKPASMGWCRICKVDCETVEGLDLHSQTREHQKMAMDMVLSIKQQNEKKQKTSNDHSSLEEGNKSRTASFEGRGNKH